MSINCKIGNQNKNCFKTAPCMKNGLCYTETGQIPTSFYDTFSDSNVLEKMNLDCSNDMYQSQFNCPKHCQWLGGKTNRCQSRKGTLKKSPGRELSLEELRSLNVAMQQPRLKGFIKNKPIQVKKVKKSVKKISKKDTNQYPDCYKFTKEDKSWREEGGKKGRKFIRTEKEMCERHGYRYTKGVNNSISCGKCWCCKNMTGGGNCDYNKIINPISGRKVNINTNLGKSIINNYLNFIN